MKTRFCLLWMVLAICQMAFADVHISVSHPDTWSAEELRPYIGKTVVFDVPMVVTSNYNGYTISTRRLFHATNQALPRSSAYDNIVRLNKSGAITLNGVRGYHRCGEKIYNLRAKVNSTNSLTVLDSIWSGNTRADLEAGIPDLGDYRLQICTMNLEYYLATDYPSSGSMGPRSQAQHDKQRAKINKALTRINADAYGFVEIQQGSVASKEIADDLNKSLPGRNYTYIADNTAVSGSYTKSGYVYDSNKLRPLGRVQQIDEKVQNRKMMICFEEIDTHERFIFSVNHFKAKTSGGSGADADMNDGQGSYNASRCQEAQAVVDKYKIYREDIIDGTQHIAEKDILIMGDLNAYAKEDPIIKLLDAGMIDLHRVFHADSSYSYQYHYTGMAGYLDHALCNSSMRPQITGMAGYHINSDEDDKYTYDKSNDETMFRCSDHDPVLVGLKLDGSLTYDPTPMLNQLEVLNGKADEITIQNAYKEGQNCYYAIYDIYGRLISKAAKHPIESNLQPIEMPSAQGVYILYIYYDRDVYRKKFIVR